nr:MAG TPA_asm: hypothetical protein [Caudoviricetes sp.]
MPRRCPELSPTHSSAPSIRLRTVEGAFVVCRVRKTPRKTHPQRPGSASPSPGCSTQGISTS